MGLKWDQFDFKRIKIDHPLKGSIDVLDSVVGVTYALSKDPAARINHDATARLGPQLGSVVTPWRSTPPELEPYMKSNDAFLHELKVRLK